jgi:hypothetical protein
VRDDLADLGHASLRKGNTRVATTSTGIAAIISQMIEFKKAQSGELPGIAGIHRLLRWPDIDSRSR